MADSVCESLPRIKEVRAFVKKASDDQGMIRVYVATDAIITNLYFSVWLGTEGERTNYN